MRDAELTKVKDRCRQHCIGTADENAVCQVVERSDTAACDDRHVDCLRHRAGEFEIETFAGAVSIH